MNQKFLKKNLKLRVQKLLLNNIFINKKLISNNLEELYFKQRDVAQLGSVSALGAEGRKFKSYHPDLIRFCNKK